MAFVGAGGKTTALFRLARELPSPVVVTTSTHLGEWQIPAADSHVVFNSQSQLKGALEEMQGVTLVTGPLMRERAGPLGEHALAWLSDFCKERGIPLLVEADGARQKPLKAPESHEPNLPQFIEQVAVVVGLKGLDQRLSAEVVHRPERFASLSGIALGEVITTTGLVRFLLDEQGGLKNQPSNARRVVLINQSDTPHLRALASEMANNLLPSFHSVIITSLDAHDGLTKSEREVHAVREPIGAILLAAGASSRFGRPKQTLEYEGEPLVRRIARIAVQAGLSPVIIVTGAYHEQVAAALTGLPVAIAHNPDWKSGQSSSLRVGLQSGLDRANFLPGAFCFLLSDQPQVSIQVLQALVETHARTMAPVIAPMVDGQRANPVLFDRRTFPDLMELKGDIGGRAIFSKYSPTYTPWHDLGLLLDIDRPEDYQRLLEHGE